MTTFSAIPIPIRRFVDDDQWEAEDLAGRLGIVTHAAFLRAGFVPYSAEPKSAHLLRQVDEVSPSSPSLSRRYTAPQLLARHGDGSPTESVVQELRAVGAHGGGVAFQAYLATGDGDRRCLCRALLDEDTLAPILSGGVEDTARALGTEASGAWLWRSLTDWVCRVLLLELSRRNSLPVTSFASLPDDVRAEILKRLTDGDNLARVECTSRQLRRLAAELDVELWKPLYEELQARQSRRWWWPPVLPNDGESSGERVVSWKERYVKARQRVRPSPARLWPRRMLFSTFHDESPLVRWLRRAENTRVASPRVSPWTTVAQDFATPVDYSTDVLTPPGRRRTVYSTNVSTLPARLLEPETVVARGKSAAGRRRKVARNGDKRKPHGAGAVHSPSSRYRWKHR